MKIPPLVFMSELKIDLTLKKLNFLFLLCFKIAKIKFILIRQPSKQRYSFFSSHFTLNLMLPACLLDMILVVNKVCNWKIALSYFLPNRSQETCQERMSKRDFDGLTSRAIIM